MEKTNDQPDPRLTIEASPTKDLFISMLVKDIKLERAIVDLVDNSVDGAKRERQREDYTDLWVRIEANENYFRIADNCGGISVDTARNYAFRFGRPEDTPTTQHSVGQFGVGLKRALFKLGSGFNIESTTSNSYFALEVDVEEWKKDKEWTFEFDVLQEGLSEVAPDKRGTTITVNRLHQNVIESFRLENFLNQLFHELEQAHLISMDRGLSMTFNQVPLRLHELSLLRSNQLIPAYQELKYGEPQNGLVKVKMYAGLSESDPSSAGWYIFCNGRLVLGPDQTNITGWGEGGERTIPKYHNQFARFRGYVFFDADDAAFLPWNTTKTGVDADSPVFRAVRLEMIKSTRPVIDFLNKLDAEKDKEDTDYKPLEDTVKAASKTNLAKVSDQRKFQAPKPRPERPQPRTNLISYRKPQEEVNKLKRALKVRTNKEVGERTFEYFLEWETND